MNILDLLIDRDFDAFSHTIRWNGTPLNKPITLPHHSWWVSLISLCLCEHLKLNALITKRILSYSICHDLDEMFTGDLIHPFKHNSINGKEIKKVVEDYIKEALNRKWPLDEKSEENDLNQFFHEILNLKKEPLVNCVIKMADHLSLYNYLNVEVRMGNEYFYSIIPYCLELIIKSCHNLQQVVEQKFGEENTEKQKNRLEFIKEIIEHFTEIKNLNDEQFKKFKNSEESNDSLTGFRPGLTTLSIKRRVFMDGGTRL